MWLYESCSDSSAVCNARRPWAHHFPDVPSQGGLGLPFSCSLGATAGPPRFPEGPPPPRVLQPFHPNMLCKVLEKFPLVWGWGLAGEFCVPVDLVQSPKTPLNPENTQKLHKKKNKYKIHHPKLGHENVKKLRKMAQTWPISYFSVFVSYFQGPTGGWEFCIFSSFCHISGIQGFLGSVPGPQALKRSSVILKGKQ